MKTYIKIFLILISFHPDFAFPQGEFNNWYFGGIGPPIGAGLTFNSGSPVAIPNGVMWSLSSPVSVSESSENMLFFSNGVNVYNRNKVVMPNGSGLLGNNNDLKQFVISTPIPGDDSSYYIFTVAEYAPLVTSLLRYSKLKAFSSLIWHFYLHNYLSLWRSKLLRCFSTSNDPLGFADHKMGMPVRWI